MQVYIAYQNSEKKKSELRYNINSKSELWGEKKKQFPFYLFICSVVESAEQLWVVHSNLLNTYYSVEKWSLGVKLHQGNKMYSMWRPK